LRNPSRNATSNLGSNQRMFHCTENSKLFPFGFCKNQNGSFCRIAKNQESEREYPNQNRKSRGFGTTGLPILSHMNLKHLRKIDATGHIPRTTKNPIFHPPKPRKGQISMLQWLHRGQSAIWAASNLAKPLWRPRRNDLWCGDWRQRRGGEMKDGTLLSCPLQVQDEHMAGRLDLRKVGEQQQHKLESALDLKVRLSNKFRSSKNSVTSLLQQLYFTLTAGPACGRCRG
jgi:hypothetical protein